MKQKTERESRRSLKCYNTH